MHERHMRRTLPVGADGTCRLFAASITSLTILSSLAAKPNGALKMTSAFFSSFPLLVCIARDIS